MTQISTADFKNGMALEIQGDLFTLVEFQHINPGKGAAFVRTKIKNVRTGAVLQRTFRAGERLEQAIIDQREMQLLYREDDIFVFMDTSTYEQVEIPAPVLGDRQDYLIANMTPIVRFHDGEVIGVELPASVELTITDTEPGVQGDRVSGAMKPAVLETGKSVRVPLFVVVGDRIVIDTRTGDYLSRA